MIGGLIVVGLLIAGTVIGGYCLFNGGLAVLVYNTTEEALKRKGGW